MILKTDTLHKIYPFIPVLGWYLAPKYSTRYLGQYGFIFWGSAAVQGASLVGLLLLIFGFPHPHHCPC